jgi:hypothetical protein
MSMEELDKLLSIKYEITVNDLDNYEIYWRKL